MSSASCAMKISIASALTKPVITELETNRMTYPSLRRPAMICSTPASIVAASRYCEAMLPDQRHHQHGSRGRRGRDHARPSANIGVNTAIEKLA